MGSPVRILTRNGSSESKFRSPSPILVNAYQATEVRVQIEKSRSHIEPLDDGTQVRRVYTRSLAKKADTREMLKAMLKLQRLATVLGNLVLELFFQPKVI